MIDFALVGAGISGLATAWFLQRAGFSVSVFEAAAEPGGTIGSYREAGFLIERGPNSTLENTEALGELIAGVGIRAELQLANPQARRRYILKQGRLLPLPLSPLAFLRTPLFSGRAKLRLLGEPFVGRAQEEESIAQFVRRRLGSEFLDWALDPFVSGVYAGDAERLSVQAAVGKVYALEREYGSLLLGAVRRALAGGRSGPAPAGRLISFSGGMAALPRAVSAALGEAVQLGTRVTRLERMETGWRLHRAGKPLAVPARRVVLAMPAYAAAALVEPFAAKLASELRDIEYPPVASVALGFPRSAVQHPLDGFGFLVPRRLGVETLGCLFSSTLFPGRAPQGQVLLTAFIGGARNPQLLERKPEALVQQVLRDIEPVLGLRGEPSLRQVSCWPRAIPQYQIGHLQRLHRIDAAFSALPGLYRRANWSDGISVADCVRNGRDFARRFSD
jgi:oxygen-dependent protoporphyrinogen oxidase